jgi:cellulose synthase/poly-beta-1,6-N-acetylglucosamine synthase-like glycosyltransferase
MSKGIYPFEIFHMSLGSTVCTGSENKTDWAVENDPSLVRWYLTSFAFFLSNSLEWIHKLLIYALDAIKKCTLLIFMMNLKVKKRISIFKASGNNLFRDFLVFLISDDFTWFQSDEISLSPLITTKSMELKLPEYTIE